MADILMLMKNWGKTLLCIISFSLYTWPPYFQMFVIYTPIYAGAFTHFSGFHLFKKHFY